MNDPGLGENNNNGMPGSSVNASTQNLSHYPPVGTLTGASPRSMAVRQHYRRHSAARAFDQHLAIVAPMMNHGTTGDTATTAAASPSPLQQSSHRSLKKTPPETSASAQVVRKSTTTIRKRLRPVNCKATVWRFLDDPQSSKLAYRISLVLLCSICISTSSFLLTTVESLHASYALVFELIETVCIAIFTIEFILRLFSCPDRLEFSQDVFNWIDLVSILPFYFEHLTRLDEQASSLGIIRVSKLTRVARIFKVSRYSSSIRVFISALYTSVKPLTMLLFFLMIATILFSSLVYYAEYTVDGCVDGGWYQGHDDDALMNGNGDDSASVLRSLPSAFGVPCDRLNSDNKRPASCVCRFPNPFTSIPTTFWWSIVTMTTVGYGDHVPATPEGKFIAMIAMLCGMIIMALPISVIGTNFQNALTRVHSHALQKGMNVMEGKDEIYEDQIEEILKEFHSIGAGLDLNTDEVFSKYDTDQSGVIEAEELELFKKELGELTRNRRPSQEFEGLHVVVGEDTWEDASLSRLRSMVIPGDSERTSPPRPRAVRRESGSTSSLVGLTESQVVDIFDRLLFETEQRIDGKLNSMMQMMLRIDQKLFHTSAIN